MARKIPGSNQQNTASQPVQQSKSKPAKKEKPAKKGLFSGFGRNKQIEKSRENLKVAEEVDMSKYGFEDESLIDTPEERVAQNMQQQYDSAQQSYANQVPNLQQPVQQQRPQPQPMQQQRPQQMQQQDKPHISYQTADKIYNKKQMEQSVFLYCKSQYFPVIQKHYNSEFQDIRTIGTSSLDKLSSTFSERAISKFIMLFVLEQNEVQYIKDFINNLSLEQIQPNVLSILLILDSNINVESIVTTDAQRKFIKVNTFNQKKNPITKGFLNKLMSIVVNEQPSYIPQETKVIVPKQVNSSSVSKSAAKLLSRDIGSLKAEIDRLKQVSYNEDKKRSIMANILGTNELNKSLDYVESLPHLKLIKAVEDEIEAELEIIKDNPRMREQIEEKISRKLLLSTLRTSEMEHVISDVINTAVSKMEQVDSGLRDYNKNAVQELQQISSSDIALLAAKREEVKQDINKRFSQYKTLIQTVSNSANLQALAYRESKNSMGKLLKDNSQNVSDEILTVAGNALKTFDIKKEDYLEQVTISNNKMIEVLNLTNVLMQSYKILVNLDDVMISSLLEENAALKQMQPVQKKVDSVFKLIGCNIVSLPGSGMSTIIQTFLKPTDLVIYNGDRNLPEDLKGIKQYPLEDFLSTSWDRPDELHMINLSMMRNVTNPMQAIRQSQFDIKDETVVDRLISKLDYVSNSYSNIYIIHEPTEDTVVELRDSIYFKRMLQHLESIVIWSPIDNRHAIMISQISKSITPNIHSIKIFLNKVAKGYEESLDEFKRISNIQAMTIVLPYINRIEELILEQKPNVIKALKDIKNRMR